MALIDEDYTRISLRSEAFRSSFEEPFRTVFALTLLIFLGVAVLQGDRNYVILGLAIPVFAGIMSAVCIEIIRRVYVYKVSPYGLSCYNFWGRFKTIPWNTMRNVRRFNLFGLSYLRVTADQQRSDLRLPLFIERSDLLRDLVRAHVDEHHPLAEQLKLASEGT